MYTAMRLARTSTDLEKIFRLRHRVFVEEEQRLPDAGGMIHDLWDGLEEGINVLAEENGETVGAIRFVMDGPLGLPAMHHYDFGPLLETLEGAAVSVGWFCSTLEHRKHPGMVMGLIKGGVREARRRGGRHVIAPLHPGLFPLLKRIGATAVCPEFVDPALGVPVLPIHVDMEHFSPGVRETMDDPLDLILDESGERRVYRAGEEIIHRGESGDEAFVVMRGSVRVEGLRALEEGEREVLLGQGQLFGELSLLDGGVRSNSVVCHSREADLMVWRSEDFLRQLSSSRETTLRICRILASRLRMENVGGPKVPSVVSLVGRILVGASREGEAPVHLPWLAGQVGLWPERLAEVLREGIPPDAVEIDGEEIRVLDLAKLQALLVLD